MNPELQRLAHEAAELPSESRWAFLARECPDSQARAEVSAFLKCASGAEHWLDGAVRGIAMSLHSGQEPACGDTIGIYRLSSLLGRGGMGTVYLAERIDGEIQQRVAIKCLHGGCHPQAWLRRFLSERQLLATLRHPCIVQLIDAGHTSGGQPFLVMEYVAGGPIDRYAAGMPIRRCLNLFLRVCEAVSHAHRHLIIHRDLKPSNILVEPGDRPKLLDFGIAKLLDEEGEITQPLEQLLTPAYASPEQLMGIAQSTATDIYSLGAVLYKLLTGIPPRDNARNLQRQEPAPPSQLNPEVRRDLDFVVAKALRPDPEDRYASVDEFATDLRAAMDWRPVQARTGEFGYRARRNLRRHCIPLTAATVAIAGLSIGLFVAIHEREIATRRVAEVRQLSGKLFEIDLQVGQLPGGSKTRQLIVDTALQYLSRLASEVRSEPSLALELGTAYMHVARVQGVNISPNLGQTEQADYTAQKAQTLIESVLAAQHWNRTALLRAGQIAHDRMLLASDRGQKENARRFARICVKRLNQYLLVRPLNSSDHLDADQVALAYINVANWYSIDGQYDEALRIAGKAIDVARAANWPRQAGAAMMIVAAVHRARGELDEALKAIRESVRILEPGDGERSTGRLRPYSLALIREAQILGEQESISMNQKEEAIPLLERARAIGEDFARRDPSDFQSQYRVFTTETVLAGMLRDSNPEQALQMYDDALRRLAAVKTNAGTTRNEVMTLVASTYPLRRLGRRADARKRLDAALERLNRLRLYPAPQIELGSPADHTLRALAEFESEGGNAPRGAALCRELLRLVLQAKPKPDTSLKEAVTLSNLYRASAALERSAGRTELEASLEFRRSELWRHWAARLPNNAFVLRQVAPANPRRPPDRIALETSPSFRH
jgi:tetratricopeptide (TPR) repeat protein